MSEGLDPATDSEWEAARRLGHRMVDDMIGYVRSARSRPVWQPMPPALTQRVLDEAVPMVGHSREWVYERFLDEVLPYSLQNVHPRFWAWVQGGGTIDGMFAAFLTAAMNSNASGGAQSPVYLEQTVIRWFAELFGYPRDASGVLTSGGTMSNMIGLAVARNRASGGEVRTRGVTQDSAPVTVYASTEVHSCMERSVDVLGIGTAMLRRIGCDAQYRMNVAELRARIDADEAVGCTPICVIGNAGTVNTGAIDDLTAIARICRERSIWFHVDGAFGAMAALSEPLRPLLTGLAEADSIAFDLHKWGYVPYEVGCLLVRDPDAHLAALRLSAVYLSSSPRGMAGDPTYFYQRGFELSRSARALKVWMCMQSQGVHAWAAAIQRNVDQAQRLANLIRAHADLELLAPAPLNVVCFRFAVTGSATLDDLNRAIVDELSIRGIAAPSVTRLNTPDGPRFAIRVAITNHRSRDEDFDALIDGVVTIGRALAEGHENENTKSVA